MKTMSEQNVNNEQGGEIKELADIFQDPALKSSVRLLIVISLALNKRLGFSELLELVGSGKGSLSNHLEKLEESGYIRTRIILTLEGKRRVVEITYKGVDLYEKYLKLIEKVRKIDKKF